jgi:hypothetical protein
VSGAPGRFLAATVAVAAIVVGVAAPAAADPAEPTRFRAEVREVVPPVEGVQVDVVGGDAFVRLTVAPGRAVVVEGYEGEPWLRVSGDGRVERNTRSSATYLNDDRFGRVALPAGVDPQADPVWEQVATDGTWAWHDHRVHWMQPEPPPEERLEERDGGARLVQRWEVALVADGEPVTVRGDLLLLPRVVPLGAVAAGLAAAATAVVVGRRRPGMVAAVASVVAGAVALLLAWVERAAQPAAAGAPVLPVVLPVLGLAAAALAVVLLARRPSAGGVALLAAVAALGGWGLVRLPVLWNPVLPTTLPAPLERAGVAVVLATSVAAAVLALRPAPTG